jgi:uncharacterized membrane protein
MHMNVKDYYVSNIIYIGCLLNVHVSATFVAILREMSTTDILQKLQEPLQ